MDKDLQHESVTIVQQIFYYKISDNKRCCCPDNAVMIPHSNAQSAAAYVFDGLRRHKIQVNGSCIRDKRMIPGRLQEPTVKQRPKRPCAAAARTVITGHQMKYAGRQMDTV